MSSTATSRGLIRESLDRNQPTLTGKPSDLDNSGLSVQESIKQLAYALWELRGRPEGSPDEDWNEAERQIRLSLQSETATLAR